MNNYKYNTAEILKEMKNHPDYIFNEDIQLWRYIGKLTGNKDMHQLSRMFYFSWFNQGNRCNNPNDKSYLWYGNIGIKRIWNSRECINWAINEFIKKEEWLLPNISRKGDIGNYILGNVELKEASQNAKEVKMTKKRLKHLKEGKDKPIKLTNIINSKDYMVFKSGKELDDIFNRSVSATNKTIRRKNNIMLYGKKYKPKRITREDYITLKI